MTGPFIPLKSRLPKTRTMRSSGCSTLAQTRIISILCFTIARTSPGRSINFYYPRTIHRSLSADIGIMTPKQAARCIVRYKKHHPDLQFSSFVITQVPGTTPRSSAVRSVLGSLIKSKKYILPLASLAVLHPYLGGSLVLAWIRGRTFQSARFCRRGGFPPAAGNDRSETAIEWDGLAESRRIRVRRNPGICPEQWYNSTGTGVIAYSELRRFSTPLHSRVA